MHPVSAMARWRLRVGMGIGIGGPGMGRMVRFISDKESCDSNKLGVLLLSVSTLTGSECRS